MADRSEDADDSHSVTDTVASFARQWSVWLVTLFLLGVAAWSYGPTDEAPAAYPAVFAVYAALATLYGLEKMSAAPSPVSRTLRY